MNLILCYRLGAGYGTSDEETLWGDNCYSIYDFVWW